MRSSAPSFPTLFAVFAVLTAVRPLPAQWSVSVFTGNGAGVMATGLQSGNGRLDCPPSNGTRPCIGLAANGASIELRANNVQNGWAAGGFVVAPRGSSLGLGVCDARSPVCRFTITQAVDVRLMSYRSPWYTLTVTPSPNGSVSIDNGGASTVCSVAQSSGCASAYPGGTVLKLVSTPTSPATFEGYSGACTGKIPCTVTLDGNKTVSAAFTGNVTLTLGTKSGGHLEALAIPGGPKACTSAALDCSASFIKGTSVSIAAVPAYGFRFGSFSRGCRSTTASCSMTLTSDSIVHADFVPIAPLYRLHIDTSSIGAVEARWGSNDAIACSPYAVRSVCDTTLLARTSVTVTATPNGDYEFARWKSGCAGASNPCTMSLGAATTISAEFAPKPIFTLTFTNRDGIIVYAAGSNMGTECDLPACAPTFQKGETVTLYIQQMDVARFAGWTGACSGTALTCTLVMDKNKTVGMTWK